MEVDQPQPASSSTGRKFYNCAKILIHTLQNLQQDPYDPRWFVYKSNRFSQVHLCGSITQATMYPERFFFVLDDGSGAIRCSYWYDQEKRPKYVAPRKKVRRTESSSDESEDDFSDDEPLESEYKFPDDIMKRATDLERDGRRVRLVGANDNAPEVVDYFLKDADLEERTRPLPAFAPKLFRLGDLVTARGQLKVFNNSLEVHLKHINREPDPNTQVDHWSDCLALHDKFYSKVPDANSASHLVETLKDTLRELLVDSPGAKTVSYSVSLESCLEDAELRARWNPTQEHVLNALREMADQGLLYFDSYSREFVTNSPSAMAQDLFDAIVEESKSAERKLNGAIFRYVAQRFRQARPRYAKLTDLRINAALKFMQAEGFIYEGTDNKRWKPLERPPSCLLTYFGAAVT